MKMFILNSLNKLGLVVRAYSPKNHKKAMLQYVLDAFNIDCVLDVGANTGQYGMELLEMNYRGHILSFEPLSNAYSQLNDRSSSHTKWEAVNAALGSEEGESEIHVSENLVSSSLLEIEEQHIEAAPTSRLIDKEVIQVLPAAQFIGKFEEKNILLKIDTQGFEMEVLKGAGDSLNKVVALELELSFQELYKGGPKAWDVMKYLDDKGFELYNLFEEFTDSRHKLLQSNAFFINKNLLNS